VTTWNWISFSFFVAAFILGIINLVIERLTQKSQIIKKLNEHKQELDYYKNLFQVEHGTEKVIRITSRAASACPDCEDKKGGNDV